MNEAFCGGTACQTIEPPLTDLAKANLKKLGFSPTQDFIVVQEMEPGETESGLVIPDAEKESPRVKVLAVGPGKVSEINGERSVSPVSVGDVAILCGRYIDNSNLLRIGITQYWIVRFRDVMCRKVDAASL